MRTEEKYEPNNFDIRRRIVLAEPKIIIPDQRIKEAIAPVIPNAPPNTCRVSFVQGITSTLSNQGEAKKNTNVPAQIITHDEYRNKVRAKLDRNH
jgi:hypothetical protein